MKRILTTIALIAAVVAVTAPANADVYSAIQDGADRVVELQYTDGKWGWPLNAPPTYNNITGPIGLGLVSAYGITGDATHLSSAMSAANSLVGLTSDWVGTYNPMFLVSLYDVTGTGSYLSQAQTFFSELDAGTYTRQSVDYNTAGWIALIQTARAGTWVNLLPWEFAPQAYAASRAGNSTQVSAFVAAMEAGIETLDNTKQADLLGLAGGVMGLSWLGVDFDPTAGAFGAADSTTALADMLADYQNANGSWYLNSSLSSPSASDEDLQTTAYAMLALLAANTSGQYDDEIALGRQYLLGYQQVNGGWPSYPGGGENAEVDGEIVWALSATAPPIPAPPAVALGAIGLGLVGLTRRIRRRRAA